MSMNIYYRCYQYWRAQGESEKKNCALISRFQGIVFILLIVCFAICSENQLIISCVVFALVVSSALKMALNQRIKAYSILQNLYEDDFARLNTDWENIKQPKYIIDESNYVEHEHATDLNILGNRSLRHMIDRCETIQGSKLLLERLLDPATSTNDKDDFKKLIIELEKNRKIRNKFRQASYKLPDDLLAPMKFKSREQSLLMVILSYLLIWSLIFMGIVSGDSKLIFFGILTYALFISFTIDFKVNRNAAELDLSMDSYYKMCRFCKKNMPTSDTTLKKYYKHISNETTGVERYRKEIRRLIAVSTLQGSFFLGIVMNLFFPINYLSIKLRSSLLLKLDSHIKRWVYSWSMIEASACFAQLYDNRLYKHADICRSSNLIIEKMGHPLLSNRYEVLNSISIEGDTKVALISGANMSGKSTILRSIAINIILAQTGARVKAKKFIIPIGMLYTCISPRDSMEDGSSRFNAEVQRIKRISEHWKSNNSFFFFFIDEIFSSTNNEEREIATLHFIDRALKHNSIGFITTHDSNILKKSVSFEGVDSYHMNSGIKNGQLFFDYTLRKGQNKERNAIHILENHKIINSILSIPSSCS